MSSSQWLGSITIPGGSTLYFNTVNTPEGGIPDVPMMKSEELSDKGVDFKRWRDDSFQFPEFQMDATVDYTSDRAGVELRRSHFRANDRFVVLRVLRATTNLYIYRDVKVLGVSSVIVPGGSYGYGAESGSVGTIFTRWNMVLTRVPST